jgi:hypothetical protein
VIEPNSDSVERREASAQRALAGYRERRRRRRSDDTWFGSESLFRDVVDDGLSPDELDSRRAAILEESEIEGIPLDLAELAYDIAWDEGLDPAVGYELVRTGLGVAPPDGGIETSSDQPEVDRYLPTWMFPASPPDTLLRERMLRFSFRRLRSFLEEEGDPDEAFRRFANEPDVGHFGY